MNYFNLFNIPTTYAIDLKTLDQTYFTLQAKYHPDKAQNNDQKLEFLELSTDINQGYKILKNDYARAVYLLKLQQIDVENESANHPLPTEVLQQIWDDREELEEVEDLDELLTGKLKQRTDLLAALGEALETRALSAAAILTLRLKYLENLINRAKEKRSNAAN